MRRRRKLFLGGVVLLLALGLLGVVSHYRAKFALERYKAQLRAQGEKLSIDELIPAEPIGQANGAKAFLDAAARLTVANRRFQPEAMKLIWPGCGRVAWQQAMLPSVESEDIWPALRAEFVTNQVVLADLREAIGQPVLYFNINYYLLPTMPDPLHLRHLSLVPPQLSAAAILAMHDDHTEDAFANLQALVALPSHHREEPLLISQYLRCRAVSVAAATTWEALQYPEWTEAQLAQLQHDWESLRILPQMQQALEMERASVIRAYTLDAGSLNKILFSSNKDWEALVILGIWHPLVRYQDELHFLQGSQKLLNAIRGVDKGRPVAPLEVDESPVKFILSRVLGDGVFAEAATRALATEALRRLAVTAISIDRYQRRSGRLPQDLRALVPEFLATIPLDPMDGRPLRYRMSPTNSFLLYSVGVDGVDDNGRVRWPGGGGGGSSSSYFSRASVRALEDLVWLQPATADQIQYHVQKYDAPLMRKRQADQEQQIRRGKQR